MSGRKTKTEIPVAEEQVKTPKKERTPEQKQATKAKAQARKQLIDSLLKLREVYLEFGYDIVAYFKKFHSLPQLGSVVVEEEEQESA